MTLVIREATPGDAGTIVRFIRALAEYERLAERVEADEARVRETLFGSSPRAFCTIAEVDGEPAGFAVWFYNYSTFLARHGIWLEDLFVAPEHRGSGVGKALLADLAERCVREELGRLEWPVLDWNESAIGFYRSVGAEPLVEWQTFRLTGAALSALGSRAA